MSLHVHMCTSVMLNCHIALRDTLMVTALFSPTLLNRKSHQSKGPLHFSPAIPVGRVWGARIQMAGALHRCRPTSHFVYFPFRLLPLRLQTTPILSTPISSTHIFSLKIINSIIFLEMYIAYKLKLISSEM